MNKPYVFCHMLISPNGKIVGEFMNTKMGLKANKVFYDLAFGNNSFYKFDAWMCGRITTDDNFTFYKTPALKNIDVIPEGDYIVNVNSKNKYYVSIDPKGKVGWEKNNLLYEDTKADVIEILTSKASASYKAYLRKLNIPYLICGDSELDFNEMLEKLYKYFNIKTLMLGGGGILNYSFISAGLCDELSLVISPSVDGVTSTPNLFNSNDNSKFKKAIDFKPIDTKIIDEDVIHIRYKILND